MISTSLYFLGSLLVVAARTRSSENCCQVLRKQQKCWKCDAVVVLSKKLRLRHKIQKKSSDPSKTELFPFILNEACLFWLRRFQPKTQQPDPAKKFRPAQLLPECSASSCSAIQSRKRGVCQQLTRGDVEETYRTCLPWSSSNYVRLARPDKPAGHPCSISLDRLIWSEYGLRVNNCYTKQNFAVNYCFNRSNET